MRRLLRRLARLWGQSRIRLEQRPLEPEDVDPGDWLQVDGHLFRVVSASSGGEPTCIGLEGIDRPASKARLMAPLDCGSSSGWILLQEGLSLPVPAEAVLVFPVGERSEPSRDHPVR